MLARCWDSLTEMVKEEKAGEKASYGQSVDSLSKIFDTTEIVEKVAGHLEKQRKALQDFTYSGMEPEASTVIFSTYNEFITTDGVNAETGDLKKVILKAFKENFSRNCGGRVIALSTTVTPVDLSMRYGMVEKGLKYVMNQDGSIVINDTVCPEWMHKALLSLTSEEEKGNHTWSAFKKTDGGLSTVVLVGSKPIVGIVNKTDGEEAYIRTDISMSQTMGISV